MLFNELFENHVVFTVRDTFIITLVQSSKHNNSDMKKICPVCTYNEKCQFHQHPLTSSSKDETTL